jgi:hypothetical protein
MALIWQRWAPVSEGSSTPGAPIAAVPWEDSFALFISDPNGDIYAIKATPGFGWELVPGLRSTPGAPITALFTGSGFTLFIADENGEIFTTSGAPYQGWQTWTPVSEGSSTPGAPVAAIPWDDSFALFISDPNGDIYGIKATPGFGWELVPGLRSKPGGQVAVVSGTATPPGSISAPQEFLLFMVDVNGEVSFTSGFPYQSWDGWTSVSEISSVPGAGVTVVPQVVAGDFADFSSLTIFVADSGGEVNETRTSPPFILFESNFGSTTANQPPSPAQAVGTATFNGPNLVISPTFEPAHNWLQIGPLSQDGGQFNGIFITTPAGPGVYALSAMMFMSSESAESYINFSSSLPSFLTLLFADNNQVQDGGLQPTGCTFPRDRPFLVQVTITVGGAPATAQIEVDGTVANYDLHVSPSSFSSVGFAQENPGGSGFDVTDIVVTYTAQ